VIAFLLTAYCSLLTVHAQTATATVSGTVEDQNGAVVPGVSITIQNRATSLERQATTNDSGQFTIPLLSPGTYTIIARDDGFTTAEIRDVVLNVGDQKAFQIQLKTGNINETVNITGQTPLINESPAVGTVVDRQFVENLPLNGRSFQSLITLSPGVVLTKASGGNLGQFSVNGQRADANYFTVDGVSANVGIGAGVGLNEGGGGALPGFGATGGTNNLISVDALQEFKIQTSTYAAEFGRTPGAQVQLVTRAGTNKITGSVFEYFRNDKLDSNNWFANRNGLAKPPLRHNQFGGVLGGPIRKNKTFFFFSYEGLRLRQPTVSTASVPSQAVRLSAPAAILPFLKAIPVPNGTEILGANGSATGLAQYAASFSNPANFDATSIRIDNLFNDKVTLFGRYNYSPSDSAVRQRIPSQRRSQALKTHTLTLGMTWVWNSSLTDEFRANYSRNQLADVFTLDNLGGAVPLDLTSLAPSSVSPQDVFVSFFLSSAVNYAVGRQAINTQRQVNIVNNVSFVSGDHQIKFGMDYRRLTPVSDPRRYGQTYSFSGIGLTAPGVSSPAGTLLSGKASSATVATLARVELLSNSFSAYGQDTWKIKRRITLTYGLRWEVNPPPRGRSGNDLFTVQGLDNLSTLTIAPRGTPLYRTTYNNFAPRVGVAYQLTQRRNLETLLRGGFGVFYDLGTGVVANAANSFPYAKTIALTPPAVTLPLTSAQTTHPLITLDPPYGLVQGAADPNLKLPRILQWNFAVEQGLGANQVVSATYVGAVGRRLLTLERLAGGTLNSNFTSVDVTRNTGSSDYHSLQIQFNRRLSRRLQALASYTWAHSIDTASQDAFINPPQERVVPQQNRGSSDFDVRHAFNGAMTYQIPAPKVNKVAQIFLRNWSINTVLSARTATPVDVTSSRNVGFGFIALRPDLVNGVPLYITDPTVAGGRRINPAAFAVSTASRQGTLGRNSLRGFPFWQLDFALSRQLSLSERTKLQLKAEFFNILNHPNFADPDSNLTSATFGQSTQMLGSSLGSSLILSGLNPAYQIGGPRSIQLSLRLVF